MPLPSSAVTVTVGLPLSPDVADPSDLGVDPAKTADLVARARREVDDGLLPSCQVALARHGQLAAFETIGAPPGSRYVLFSTTKALTAGAVWLLIGDGLLDVQRPVAHYIPEFASNGKEIVTVEQVLLHTAGFPHAPLGPPQWFDRPARLEAFAAWRLNWEPGSQVEYHATSAHWVLAELIERLAGIDHRRFVAERITEPLGLPSLQLGVPTGEQGDVQRVVHVGEPPTAEELAAVAGVSAVDLSELDLGEVTDETVVRFNEPEVLALGVPGAGAVGSAADMALYMQALLHNPGGLWDADVLADATTRVRTTQDDALIGIPANRSLGLLVAGDDGLALQRGMGKTTSSRAFGHHGVGGQLAWADPETGLSFCFLTNGHDRNPLAEGPRRAGLNNRAGAALAD